MSHVLLPLDGDGELSEEQKARIAEIRERSDHLVAENLADLDDDDDDGGAAPEAAPTRTSGSRFRADAAARTARRTSACKSPPVPRAAPGPSWRWSCRRVRATVTQSRR